MLYDLPQELLVRGGGLLFLDLFQFLGGVFAASALALLATVSLRRRAR